MVSKVVDLGSGRSSSYSERYLDSVNQRLRFMSGCGRRRHQRIADNVTVLDETLVQMDDGAVMKMMLNSWMEQYYEERGRYHSASLFCMIKMGEIDIVTLPLGRINAVKTAICLDLLECISNSIRSKSLGQILHLLRNEMMLSIYEGPILHVRPGLQDLFDMCTYFNQYPALTHRLNVVQRRISQVVVSPGEFRDVETRKMFVINYQTNRYARRIETVVFRVWHLSVMSSKRMVAKLKRFSLSRNKERRLMLNKGTVMFAWQRWRICKIQRLNDRNERNVIDVEHAGDVVDVEHGIVHSELSRITEQLHAVNTELTAINVAYKASRLHQAKLATAVSKLGPKFAMQAQLIGAMKRLISHLFLPHLNRHLVLLSQAVNDHNFLGFSLGPNIAPESFINKRLQARSAALSSDPKWNMASIDSLNRAASLLEGEDCVLVRLIQGLFLDPVVIKTLLMNALLPVPVTLPVSQPTTDLFPDVAFITSFKDIISSASSLKSDLSLPSTKHTLSQIPETLSTVRSASLRKWESFFDLIRFQNDLLSCACLNLLKGVHLNSQSHRLHGNTAENETFMLLSALVAGEQEIEPNQLYEAVHERSKSLRQLYNQGLISNGEGTSGSLSWFEFWNLIRTWPMMVQSGSKLTIFRISQIWVDVLRRNNDYLAAQSSTRSVTAVKPKVLDEYFMNDVDLMQWQAILIRIARIQFETQMSVLESLDLILLEAEAARSEYNGTQDDWLCRVAQPAVRNVFNVHRAFLMSIFTHHCKQSIRNQASLMKMEAHELQQFWNQCKLVDLGLSLPDLHKIFDQVTKAVNTSLADGESQGLLFPQFCQVIGCFSCFYQPVRNPFIPLEDRITTFILKHLKPLHKSK